MPACGPAASSWQILAKAVEICALWHPNTIDGPIKTKSTWKWIQWECCQGRIQSGKQSNKLPCGMLKEKVAKLGTMMMATDTKKPDKPESTSKWQNQHQNWLQWDEHRCVQGQLRQETTFLMANHTKHCWITAVKCLPQTWKKPGQHHCLSIQAWINVEMATMYMGIKASKAGYEEKQVYSWQIMAKAVKLRTQQWLPQSTKETGNHHFLSIKDQINVEPAQRYNDI